VRRNQPDRNTQQLQVNDDVFTKRRTPIRDGVSANPLHFTIGLWNNLPVNLSSLDFQEFKRETRKYELYRMLQVRGWNAISANRIAMLSEDFWDF